MRTSGNPAAPVIALLVAAVLHPLPTGASPFDRAFWDTWGDGHAEIYGRLRADLVPVGLTDLLAVRYLSFELGPDEVRRWANELASYWYPSFNTDIHEMQVAGTWPREDTEPEVVAELDGLTVEPSIVILGKPLGGYIDEALQ